MKNQQGKSMVEMLAVMAIASVLVVTGITAYNYAMTKHQANELVYKSNLAYVDVMTRDSLDNWKNLKITGLNNISLQGKIYNDAGFIMATDIEKDICENILNNNPDIDILTPENTQLTACVDINTLIFDFAKAGTIGVKCESDTDCATESNQYCSSVSGVCINKTDCQSPTPIWSFNYDKCVTCATDNIDTPHWDGSACVACVTADETKPYWNDKIKKCDICPDNLPVWSGTECSCPLNSSTIVIEGNQINNTDCYCDENYVYDENLKICVLPITAECKDGYIVTLNNGVQYCVSNATMSWYNARSWCESYKMSLQNKDDLCPNKPVRYGSCPNITNIANNSNSDIGVWAINYYGVINDFASFYRIHLLSGHVGVSYYYHPDYYRALCR